MMDFEIVPFRFFGESQERYAALIGSRAVEIPIGVPPNKRCVAPFIQLLMKGQRGNMATVRADGSWTAFEAGRL